MVVDNTRAVRVRLPASVPLGLKALAILLKDAIVPLFLELSEGAVAEMMNETILSYDDFERADCSRRLRTFQC